MQSLLSGLRGRGVTHGRGAPHHDGPSQAARAVWQQNGSANLTLEQFAQL